MKGDKGGRRHALKAALRRLAEESEARVDRLRGSLRTRSGRGGRVGALPYRGHGNADRVLFHGRVLENAVEENPTPDDSAIMNLAAMYRRFGSREVPGARVRLTFGQREAEVATDEEGFFSHSFEPGVPTEATNEWQHAQVEVTYTPWGTPFEGATIATALRPSPRATFGVISDVDDTVLQSNAQKRLAVIMRTALGNATTRLPFEGVAPLYNALRNGRDGNALNPFFYVSSSPWNLYDFLVDFFRINDIPEGPLFLKDLGIGPGAASLSDHDNHKLDSIGAVLETHSDLAFVLMGDSGERDPEIYSQIVRRYPGRVKAVVIRDVTDDGRDAEVQSVGAALETQGIPTVLAGSSVDAASMLADLGLVPADAVTRIAKIRGPSDAGSHPLDALLDEAAAQTSLDE